MTEKAMLTDAYVDIGRLIAVCKRAYVAQFHRGTALSVMLLDEIHRHEPTWHPEPTSIGKDPAKR